MGDDIDRFDGCELYEEEYIVEKILEKKKYKNVWKYKVKWEGYSYDETTWEPIENLEKCKHMVEEFEEQLEAKAKSKAKNKEKNEKRDKSETKSVKESKEKSKKLTKKRKRDEENENEDKFDNEEAIQDQVDEERKDIDNINEEDKLNQQSPSSQMSKDFSQIESMIVEGTDIQEELLQGNLEEHQPIKIETATILNDCPVELNCLISWHKSDDGKVPKSTWISSNIIRRVNPNLLLQYYETKLRFPNFRRQNIPTQENTPTESNCESNI